MEGPEERTGDEDFISRPSALAVNALHFLQTLIEWERKERAYSGKNNNKDKRQGIVCLRLNIVLSLPFIGNTTTFKLK